jgi:hypothetical protein
LASFLAALVFFASNAEGRVLIFNDEVVGGAVAEELGGAVSSGTTDAVALVVCSAQLPQLPW